MSYGGGFPTEPYIGQYVFSPNNNRNRPPEGPRTVWVQLIWNNVVGQALGSGVLIQIPQHLVNTLSQIASVFVDNSQSVTDIVVVFPDTGQTIWVPSGYQSLYPAYTNGTSCKVYQVNPDQFSVTALYLLNQYETPFVSAPHTPINSLGLNTNGAIINTFSGTPVSPDWPSFITQATGSLSAVKLDFIATCVNANDVLALELFDAANPLTGRVYNTQTLSPAAGTLFSRYDMISGLHAKWGDQGLKCTASTLSGGGFNFVFCSLGIYA